MKRAALEYIARAGLGYSFGALDELGGIDDNDGGEQESTKKDVICENNEDAESGVEDGTQARKAEAREYNAAVRDFAYVFSFLYAYAIYRLTVFFFVLFIFCIIFTSVDTPRFIESSVDRTLNSI